MLHSPGRFARQVNFGDGDAANHPEFIGHATWGKASDLPRRDWVYGRHRLIGSVSATIADGGVGKTTLALTEAIAMATGRDLLGVRPNCAQRVLYWNGEEDRCEIERRVHAICQHYGIDPERELSERGPLDGALHIASGLDMPICIARMGAQGMTFDSSGIESLADYICSHDIVAATFDPFVACHQVPENDNTAINAVVQQCARLAAYASTAIELIQHTRKPLRGGTVENTVADARGASALIDAVRSARVLNRMTEAEGRQAKVENHRSYFRADNGKANYAPPADAAHWYQIAPVTLPNRDPFDDTDASDSVGVVLPWRFPQPFDDVTPAHMQKVRDMARAGSYRADPQSPDWIGRAVAEVLNLDAEDDKTRIKAVLRQWLANGVLKVTTRKDETRRERSFVEPGVWSDD